MFPAHSANQRAWPMPHLLCHLLHHLKSKIITASPINCHNMASLSGLTSFFWQIAWPSLSCWGTDNSPSCVWQVSRFVRIRHNGWFNCIFVLHKSKTSPHLLDQFCSETLLNCNYHTTLANRICKRACKSLWE